MEIYMLERLRRELLKMYEENESARVLRKVAFFTFSIFIETNVKNDLITRQ